MSIVMKKLPSLMLLAASTVIAQICPDPPTTGYARQTLIAAGVAKQPVEMAVAKDGRVFVAERAGIIRVYTPSNSQNAVAATLSVYLYVTTGSQNDVGGILGLAVSPNFATDNWLYVYYAPLSLWNGAAENHTSGRLTYRLSRFQVLSNNTLNLSSEQVLLSVPSIWETHNGGSMHFGKNGDLFLSIGDNDCAGCSNQYSPMDERPGYEFSDDQRSTANTNSLLGKVLRIHPVQDSVNGKLYTIPAGNLFPVGKDSTLPEIYTMGHRNPYRIFPDPITGRLYIGEFGPAATSTTARGPVGADQLKITDSAAFLGYPYFLKDNRAYCHWDYATGACKAIQGQTSMNFDPLRPVNTSPNNTGLRILPPAKPAVAWDNEATDNTSPNPVNTDLSGCGMGGGPVYHYDPLLNSTVKFPPYFENKWIIYAIFGSWQPKLLTIPSGPVARLSQGVTMPWTTAQVPNFSSGGIQDMEFGDGDGALYVLDYGATQYANNSTAALYRVTYTGCLPATPILDASGKKLFPTSPTWAMPGQSIVIPDGSRRATLFDLSGMKIWEEDVQPRNRRDVRLPSSLGSGPFLLRFY
jgi:cytochrome c